MSLKRSLIGGSAILAVIAAFAARPATQEFGSITFPTSGAPGAQEAFLTGVKALHNFQFDEAAEAFQRAEKADPAFAMAYWGEAMSHNHPLWAQQDVEKAKQALDKLDPTPAGRSRQGPLAEGEGVLRGASHAVFLAGRQAGARPGVFGGPGAHDGAVAGRSRNFDLVCAVAARYSPARRRRFPAPGSGRVDRRAGVPAEPEASGRRALHHPRVRRSGSRAPRPRGGGRLREDCTLGRACAPHALAHLRAARDVAEGGGLQRRCLQGGHRAQCPDEARRGPRGLPHAVVARLRQRHARPVRRVEEERGAGEGCRGPQPDQRGDPRRVSRACGRD